MYFGAVVFVVVVVVVLGEYNNKDLSCLRQLRLLFDSGFCCVCVTSFEHQLTPLVTDSAQALCASFCFRL